MRWVIRAAVAGAILATLALLWQPAPVQRAWHWLHYRLTGVVPPPLVAGQHGRIFLGNHEGSPRGSLISSVCGSTVDAAGVARAVAALRPVLDAGHSAGVPFGLLIVPTAPRIYPQDLPPGTPCTDPAADRLTAALHDPAVIYPASLMQTLATQFDVLPRRHFHWAGEGPLRVAEDAARRLGLTQAITLTLRADNRASDLNLFDPGVGLHDRIGTPNLKAAGVAQCWGDRCSPAVPPALDTFVRPGTGRLLILADSFGDEAAGDFAEFAATVWLVRMNTALVSPLPPLVDALRGFHPDAILALYHDAGALALDAPSQLSLAMAARLIRDAGLPPQPRQP